MGTITRLAVTRPVLAYVVLTFTISWGGAWVALGSGGMSDLTPMADPRFPFAVLAMLAGPSLSGLLMIWLTGGPDGLRALRSRAFAWRVDIRWYAVALLTAPVLMSATLVALSLLSPGFVPGIVISDDRVSLLLVGLAVGLSAGIVEELGWTGFATPRLRRRHGVLVTGLLVGVVWGAWHLLTNVFWASSATAGDVPMPYFLSAGVAGALAGYLPAYRVLMVWVYDHTASLLVAMLMHVSLTASLLVLNPLEIAGAPLLAYSFALAAATWLAVAVVVAANRSWLKGSG
jgi:uncharacterized protein